MVIPQSFITILSARPFGQSTLAVAQSYLSIRPVQIKKTFRFDSQCDAHAHQSHPSLLLAVMLRRARLANNAQFRHSKVTSIGVTPCNIAAFTRVGGMDNGTKAKVETVKSSERIVDDVRIRHVQC
ncbi:hypothetical protein PspLS_07814 [Pyricularia sp. CBS 133598]|nr:hypothetical protein PspLS_07814 [Pyricularia sp. CBS 133598]